MSTNTPLSFTPVAADWTRRVNLVFLVGCPRSGTTWLQAMLAGHPSVYTGPETHFFELLERAEQKFRQSRSPKRHGVARYWSDEQFYAWMGELFRGTISALPSPPVETMIFLEKTPAHCLQGDFIARAFPQARFIHLVRDGRAVVASLLRLSEGKSKGWAPKRVAKAVAMWKKCVRAGRKISTLVSNPSQFVEVRYEGIRCEPEAQLAALFSWMGLQADADRVRAIVQANSLENVLHSNERFPSITRVGAEEKKFRDRFFGPAPIKPDDVTLSGWQRVRVEWLARGLLRELGYRR